MHVLATMALPQTDQLRFDLFARGAGIAPGSDSGTPSVNDVPPTILAWLGLPLGEDMDGRVTSFLEPPSR